MSRSKTISTDHNNLGLHSGAAAGNLGKLNILRNVKKYLEIERKLGFHLWSILGNDR